MSFLRRSATKELPVPPKLARELERDRPKRYLVIGSDGHGRSVDSYRWDKLPAGINVSDYDVLILNFAAFEEDAELAKGFPVDRLPPEDAMTRLLFAEHSEIVAIGNPGTLIGAPPEVGRSQQPFYDPRERADYWLPFFSKIEERKGTA